MRGKNSALQVYIANLVSYSYERIFHEQISDEVRQFLRTLSYVAVGMLAGTLLLLAFNVLAGRILGTSEYGHYTLVESIAMFLYIPMLLGFSSGIIKYSAEKDEFGRQSRIISTGFILILASTIVSTAFIFAFSSQLSGIFSISREFFYLPIIFAISLALFTITTNTLRGLHKMLIFTVFRVVQGVILLAAFLGLVFLPHLLSFKSAVIAMFLANGLSGLLLLLFPLRKYLSFRFDRSWASVLSKYGTFAVLGGISSVLYVNIDKILISKYMLMSDVGIYRAYYVGSINVAFIAFAIFNTVFFPTISKYESKGFAFQRIGKFIPYLIVLGIPIIFVLELIILEFYGGEYPMDFSLMLLFAATSVLIVWFGLYDWTFCSQGVRGVRYTAIGALGMAILNILLNTYLIPRWGLYGAVSAIAISFVAGIGYLYSLKGKIA